MSDKTLLTEGRLREALQRLLDGNPRNVKAKGKLTLNRINNEAGLGNSYIHNKNFKDFVEYAKPIIAEYNSQIDNMITASVDISAENSDDNLSELERCRIKLAREKRLKEEYRQSAQDKDFQLKDMTNRYNTMLFRVQELQDEVELLSKHKVTYITP